MTCMGMNDMLLRIRQICSFFLSMRDMIQTGFSGRICRSAASCLGGTEVLRRLLGLEAHGG
jgi:hypothetical protein